MEKHALRGAEIGAVRRKERWNLPPVAVPEAVINAVAHTDYAQRGAPLRVSGLVREVGTEPQDPRLALFRTALDYWCRADYAYGIQAAYANIGTTYARWGNHLRDRRFVDQARSQYLRAVEWLGRCLEFAARARVGEDTSQAQGMLAEIHVELGNLDAAWQMARAAYEAAERAGNRLDLAETTFTLGTLHAAQADVEAAHRLLSDARDLFEQLGHAERAAEISRHLAVLGSAGTPKTPLRSGPDEG